MLLRLEERCGFRG